MPTLQMLQKFLAERGFEVVCLNGSMDRRKRLQDAFAKDLFFVWAFAFALRASRHAGTWMKSPSY